MRSSQQPTIIIQRAAAACVRPLRAAILRPGRPVDESVYPRDEAADAAHFAALDGLGHVIGSASIYREVAAGTNVPCINSAGDPWQGDRAWRLRGMTVMASHRCVGTGSALMRAVIEHARQHSGACLWFHARCAAKRFYERHGCAAVGDTYDVSPIGEHIFMWRAIDEQEM